MSLVIDGNPAATPPGVGDWRKLSHEEYHHIDLNNIVYDTTILNIKNVFNLQLNEPNFKASSIIARPLCILKWE